MKKKIIIIVTSIIIIVGLIYVIDKIRINDNANNSNKIENNNVRPQETEQKEDGNEETVIIAHNEIKNIEKLDEFIHSINTGNIIQKVDKITIVNYTIEGDEIITTLRYEEGLGQYLLAIDNTKDRYANEYEKGISIIGYPIENYDIKKKIENGYVYIMLEANKEIDEETKRPIEDVTICSYSQELENR